MKTLFVFLAGYAVAELVTHLILYYGGALPFTAFGHVVNTSFNNKAILIYGVLALIFLYLAFRR